MLIYNTKAALEILKIMLEMRTCFVTAQVEFQNLD